MQVIARWLLVYEQNENSNVGILYPHQHQGVCVKGRYDPARARDWIYVHPQNYMFAWNVDRRSINSSISVACRQSHGSSIGGRPHNCFQLMNYIMMLLLRL